MMQTRCPHCGTTFRIAAEQLKARQGRVRCGKCQGIFDALAELVTAEPPVPEAAVPQAKPAAETEEPEPAIEVPESAESEPEAKAEAEPGAVSAPPVIAPEPLLHEEESPRPGRRRPWALGSLLALVVLAAQALLHFRTEVIVIVPEARPFFAAVCDALGCELTLPRKIDLIGIETSELSPDKGKEGRLSLSATLRNRAPFAQTWPHLEITLTDAQDRALLRRALAPADYLPEPQAIAAGFPANAEQAVQLTLDAEGIAAVGYRLYIFHP